MDTAAHGLAGTTSSSSARTSRRGPVAARVFTSACSKTRRTCRRRGLCSVPGTADNDALAWWVFPHCVRGKDAHKLCRPDELQPRLRQPASQPESFALHQPGLCVRDRRIVARWVRIEHAQYDSVRKTVQLKRDFYPSNPFTRLGRLSQSDRA